MADEKEPKPAPAPSKRVAVLTPDGQFATIDQSDIENLPDGARVLRKKEAEDREEAIAQASAQKAVDERYEALPTSRKVLGALGTAGAALTGNILGVGSSPDAPPIAAAYGAGVRQGLTGGLHDAGVRALADAAGGKTAGDRYAEQVDQQRAASPYAHGAGEFMGTLGGAVLGEEALLRGLPSSGTSALGSQVEKAAGRALASDFGAPTTTIGRALRTGAEMGARGVVEGGIGGATGYAGDAVLHDHDLAADKLFAATGAGALVGGLAAGSMGAAGSLLKSGYNGLAGAIARRGESAATAQAANQVAREVKLSQATLDAGLHEPIGVENPLTFAGRRPVIDPDAGLHFGADDAGAAIHSTGRGRYSTVTEHVPVSDIHVPPAWEPGRLQDVRAKRAAGIELDPVRLAELDANQQALTGKRFGIVDGIHRTNVALERGEPSILAKYEVSAHPQKLNNDVFNMRKPIATGDGGFTPGPLEVRLDPEVLAGGAGHEAARAPIQIPEVAPNAATSKASGTAQPRARRLANEFAFDALGATKGQASKALEHVSPTPEGAKQAVGEYLNRAILGPATEGSGGVGGAYRAAMSGRADDLLTAIRADKMGRISAGITEAVNGTAGRFNLAQLQRDAYAEYQAMLRDPQRITGADAFYRRLDLELSALYNAGKVAQDGTIDAAEAFYTRAGLERRAYEVGQASGSGGEAYRGFLRHWDRKSVEALDEAARKSGKAGVGDNIRHWKREWQLASAAEEAAEGGAERVSGNNFFGLREGVAGLVAAFTGHPVGGLLGPLAFKVAKERGKAVAAFALSKIADRGALASIVQQTDADIARASKGLLSAPPRGTDPAIEFRNAKALARTAAARAAAFDADPQSYVDKVTRDLEPIAAHSPEIAEAMATKQVRAAMFLASKVPQQDHDPLDPHPAPRMTPIEEASLARYAWYLEKPQRFFAEVARGRLTVEGSEVAQEFMPGAFDELRAQTADALAMQLARGNRLPFRQRQLLGQLLDFAATPNQRPDHRAFLQECVSMGPIANDNQNSPPPPHSARLQMALTSGVSPLDRLEAGIGRGRG